ncbi:MAG: nucleotidyltransferase [Chitinophagaceae bacterium]|nr:MAG: nucleotidyltransferase [Chitinophagaceae bacterium]
MNIVIPMAGMGKRMRPHTLTIPKPLIPVGGKPIVQRLVEDITDVVDQKIENIGFIIGDFGTETENKLLAIAEKMGAKGHIFYQDEPLGTAHAILCAKKILSGPVVVAFADTLFRTDFKMDTSQDGIIWVHKVENPSSFGVVKLDKSGMITDFIEKPETFVSDLAIIGIYFFKDGENLKNELNFLIDNDIKDKGEYQITNALENMKNKGIKLIPGEVTEWMDCGNKDATVQTNGRVLHHDMKKGKSMIDAGAIIKNSTIIEPCYLAKGVKIENSVIGPGVSIGENTVIRKSVISNSIIQTESEIEGNVIDNSMIGNNTSIISAAKDLSIGDYNHKKD